MSLLESKWIDVDKKIPKKVERVIVSCKGDLNSNQIGYLSFDKNIFYSENGEEELAVTHWMPLPNPIKD